MRRAVAFAENIKVSQKVARLFEVVTEQLAADTSRADTCAMGLQNRSYPLRPPAWLLW